MANGRLGSAKITPVQAALLYSNSSGSQAVINIQATSLSASSNANVAFAIDSSSVTLNQTTTDTALTSGNVTQNIYNLDPLSHANPIRHDFLSVAGMSVSQSPVSYWNGSTWYLPSSGMSGSPGQAQKIDPYFIRSPSAYGGKTSAELVYMYKYNSNASDVRMVYANLATMSGTTFGAMQQYRDPGHTYSQQVDHSYMGFGFSSDPYSNIIIGIGTYGWQGFQRLGSAGADQAGTSTSNSWAYQYGFSSNYPDGYTHFWYAPRIMGSKGMFIFQGTGYNGSYFCISDAELAITNGNLSYAVTSGGTFATMTWWNFSVSASQNHIGWFEYNPNDDRYYFEYLQGGLRSIYSFTRTGIRDGFTTRGSTTAHSWPGTTGVFTNHGAGPWGAGYITRPIRIEASLWWATSSTGASWVSTDLKTWQASTTYYASLSYPANTFNVAPLTTTSYKFAQVSTANISRFTSGYANVSQTAVLEVGTSISNYQRTGLLLSNGDKLYAQNYGAVDFSATVMGYEG